MYIYIDRHTDVYIDAKFQSIEYRHLTIDIVLNMRIIHSGSKAQDEGISETMLCNILVFMWSFWAPMTVCSSNAAKPVREASSVSIREPAPHVWGQVLMLYSPAKPCVRPAQTMNGCKGNCSIFLAQIWYGLHPNCLFALMARISGASKT